MRAKGQSGDGPPTASARLSAASARGLRGVERIMREGLDAVYPAAQLALSLGGETIFSESYGFVDPENKKRAVTRQTLFDIASVTKLFVASAFMTLVEAGSVRIDDRLSFVVPEFSGPRPILKDVTPSDPTIPADTPIRGRADAGATSFRALLRHDSGLPSWLPLYRAASDRGEALRLVCESPFAYQPGTRVLYSDLGLILLGLALERLAAMPLDRALRLRVLDPLGLSMTRYLPSPTPPIRGAVSSDEGGAFIDARGEARIAAPTEYCPWRGRRPMGEVHDENAAMLGGVAGHAGLFSTAEELLSLGRALAGGAAGFLRPDTLRGMKELAASDGALRRGLGLALWSPDPEAASNPLSPSSFGHNGFTGASLWIDPELDLVIACLTNRVYYGRDPAGITAFRLRLHRAILEALTDRPRALRG